MNISANKILQEKLLYSFVRTHLIEFDTKLKNATVLKDEVNDLIQ